MTATDDGFEATTTLADFIMSARDEESPWIKTVRAVMAAIEEAAPAQGELGARALISSLGRRGYQIVAGGSSIQEPTA